jgi:phosphatidate cytidylyltransferase
MAVLLMSIYIIAGLSSILFVRDIDHVGRYIYLLIFLGAWMTDIFAYFTGYFFGKHKLIEDVSPKKTIEGSIGGVIFCTLSFIGFGLVMKYCFSGYDVNLWFLGVSGVIISLVSQVGDLIMSVIKRHYGIKDYGKIFPGHGGMLDRFDSILAVSLALCALCMFGQLTGISLLEQIPLA